MATAIAPPQDIPELALAVATDAVRRVDRGTLARRLATAEHRRASWRTVGATIGAGEIHTLTLAIGQLDSLIAGGQLHVARARFAEFRRDLARILSALDQPED